MKRASEVPPPVESSGARPVTSATASATRSVNGPRGGEERDGVGGVEGQFVARRRSRRGGGGFRLSSVAGVQRSLKRMLKTSADFAGNHVGRGIADVDGDDFEVGRLEIRACPSSSGGACSASSARGRARDGIVGEMRIGDVALLADQLQPPGQRAAPAVLDRVAERRRRWSARRARNGRCARRARAPIPPACTVPSTAGPSSSPVSRKPTEPVNAPAATKRSAAASEAATPPFMSAAPRPQSRPSATSPPNGSKRQRARSPGGTTSVWPAKARQGDAAPKRA